MLRQFDNYIKVVLEAFGDIFRHGGTVINYKRLHRADYDIFEHVVSEKDLRRGIYFDISTKKENRKTNDTVEAVELFCRDADQKGVYLFGHCYPWEIEAEDKFQARRQALVNFYVRLFDFIHMGSGWIYRKPKPTK